MIHRSRRGCWTCKRRHKKCDEKRPVCERCVQAGMTCEGYKTRLTWGSSDTASSTGAGVVLNPVRKPRSQSKALRIADADLITGSISDHSLDLPDLGSVPSPDELDLLCLQFESSSESLPDETISQRLMETFTTTGYKTLTGRAGQDTLFRSDVLPLCESSISLKHACLAYQASLNADTSQWTPLYMQSALSHYLNDLNTPSRLSQDVTLATGVLLCSVSISSLYVWSPLLKGLHGVIQTRELLSNMHRSPLADHLLEVIALLDIPCFTLNRISQSLDIWKLHVGPNKKSGIEQTSGLPYTLITLLANLDSSNIEHGLLQWQGELADEFMQIHLWEAFKCAGILHSRALVGYGQGPRTSSTTGVKTEVVRMRVFAAIQAIIGSGTFNFREPFARAILYPVFIAGLLAENAQERRLTRVAFQYLIEVGEERTEQVALDIITKVWNNGRDRDEVSKLIMATEAAAELNVELHFY